MMKTLQKSISLILITSILMTICPLQSNAKWRDQSDELPGMASDGAVIAVAAVGVVLIGGIIFLAVKAKKKQKATSLNTTNQENFCASQSSANPNQNQALLKLQPNGLMEKFESAARTVPVELVVKPMSNGNDIAFNTNGMQVGIRIRF